MTLAKYRLSEPKLEFPHSEIPTLSTYICSQFETKCHILGKENESHECFGKNVERYLCHFGLQLLPAIEIKGVVAFCPTFLQFLATATFLMNPRVPAQGSVSWCLSQHPTCRPVPPDLKWEQQEGQIMWQLELRKKPCTTSCLLGITSPSPLYPHTWLTSPFFSPLPVFGIGCAIVSGNGNYWLVSCNHQPVNELTPFKCTVII